MQNDLSGYLDNSQLKMFQTCPRLYKHVYIDGVTNTVGPAARVSQHLYHAPLTEWYKGAMKHRPFDAFSASYWAIQYDKVKLTEQELLKDTKKLYSLSNAQHAFEQYTARFSSDFTGYEILAVEENVVDEKLRFLSRPDVRVRDRKTGDEGTIELKVTSWQNVLTAIEFNTQVLGQIHVTDSEFCLFTVMSFGKDSAPIRFKVERDVRQQNNWRKNLAIQTATLLVYKEIDIWPKHAPEACTRFGKECQFIAVCGTEDPEQKSRLLAEMPHADPLAYLKNGNGASY